MLRFMAARSKDWRDFHLLLVLFGRPAPHKK
jgi:hypothetical protein